MNAFSFFNADAVLLDKSKEEVNKELSRYPGFSGNGFHLSGFGFYDTKDYSFLIVPVGDFNSWSEIFLYQWYRARGSECWQIQPTDDIRYNVFIWNNDKGIDARCLIRMFGNVSKAPLRKVLSKYDKIICAIGNAGRKRLTTKEVLSSAEINSPHHYFLRVREISKSERQYDLKIKDMKESLIFRGMIAQVEDSFPATWKLTEKGSKRYLELKK
jgi:hypothetical protein